MTPLDRSVVLVAEDDDQHALLIRAALGAARLANPVQIVRDGNEAVDYLGGEGRYADRTSFPAAALLLLDLDMPGRSGLEVLAWLQSRPELSHLPAVVLTASEVGEDVTRAYELGAASYLVKPVGFDALLDVVWGLGLDWLVLNRLQGATDKTA